MGCDADKNQLGSTIEVALARFEGPDALRREVRDLKETLETRKLMEQAKGVGWPRRSSGRRNSWPPSNKSLRRM